MTRKALHTIELKEKKWKVYKSNRTDTNLTTYNHVRNESVSAVKEAKYNFEKSIAQEVKNGDTASFYAYLRSITNVKEAVTRVSWPDGSLTNSKKDTADVINSSFQSVYVKEGDGEIPQINYHFNGAPLVDVFFTVQTIHDIIKHLKVTSAPGPCSFHPKVLYECVDSLAPPRYILFLGTH